MSLCLNVLAPALQERLAPLVDPAAWRNLERLWCGIPPFWSWGCFEIRLAAADGGTDFLLCIQEQAGRRALAAALAAESPLPQLESVRPVLECWLQAGQRSPALWLEFDLPGDPSTSPFLYFVLDGATGEAPAALTSGDLVSLVERHRRLLGLGDVGEAQLSALQRCVQSLPAAGCIAHVADLEPARRSRGVRLVARLPGGHAWDWLQAIGWPGSRRLWDHARAVLGADDDCLQINVDVGETVGPVLGLETGLLAPPGPGSGESWDLLQRLTAAGAADLTRGAAVLDWIGKETLQPADAPWRIRFERQTLVKAVLDSRETLAAKAYLFFSARYTLF